MIQEIMTKERLDASLAVVDLTNPNNGLHAVNILVDQVLAGLRKKYTKTQIVEVRNPPVVTVAENFDELLFPKDNAGRSSRYTRYVDVDKVLRTHTSAGITTWLKNLKEEDYVDNIVALPGICYRRDVIDKTHCPEPHQMDIWRIRSGMPQFGRADLIDLIETILNSILPGCTYRANEVIHPYTVRGLEVEVLFKGNWLEVLECGEANPVVLQNSGLDTTQVSGLALWMGLDRLVMALKSIQDIRILRSTDSRIQKQLLVYYRVS